MKVYELDQWEQGTGGGDQQEKRTLNQNGLRDQKESYWLAKSRDYNSTLEPTSQRGFFSLQQRTAQKINKWLLNINKIRIIEKQVFRKKEIIKNIQ